MVRFLLSLFCCLALLPQLRANEEPKTPPLPNSDLDSKVRELRLEVEELKKKNEELFKRLNLFAPEYSKAEKSETNEDLPSWGRVRLDEGLHIDSFDNRFHFEFHNVTQADYVAVTPYGPLSPGGFAIPFERLYFKGNYLEKVKFYTVLEVAYEEFDLLDAWIEVPFLFDSTLRMGRTRVPFLYEMHMIMEDHLIAPERSLFNNSQTLYRNVGLMVRGEPFNKKLSYVAGIFNGVNDGYNDFNEGKDFIGYFDFMFFRDWEESALKNLHMVFSSQVGLEGQSPNVTMYRVQSSPSKYPQATAVSPIFFQYRPDVEMRGLRYFLAGDLVWYYKRFNFLGSVLGGETNFTRPGYNGKLSGPTLSYTLTGIYWLTGEEIESREEIRPLREFQWKNPLTNPGAWQFYTRYDQQQFGEELRENGFSIAELSTGKVDAVTVGLTWFPNRYTTLWLSWFHGMYGNEVKTGDRMTNHYDLYSARLQISY